MIVILLIVALIVVLASLLVGAIRRQSQQSRQDDLPYPANPEPLEDMGLLVRIGRRGRADGYAPTAVAEAALRTWLGEPRGDLDQALDPFSGLIDAPDPQSIRRRLEEAHLARLQEYERIEALLAGYPEWRIGLEAARLGMRFERACAEFWQTPDVGLPLFAEAAS